MYIEVLCFWWVSDGIDWTPDCWYYEKIHYYNTDDDIMLFVTVGITNSIAKYGNVITKGICAGFRIYLTGKVKRTDCNEGNWIIELL